MLYLYIDELDTFEQYDETEYIQYLIQYYTIYFNNLNNESIKINRINNKRKRSEKY
jgi:hypothetical protein